jgi:hypothetical protein
VPLLERLHLQLRLRLSRVFSQYNANTPLTALRLRISLLSLASQLDAILYADSTTHCSELLLEYTKVLLRSCIRAQGLLSVQEEVQVQEQAEVEVEVQAR